MAGNHIEITFQRYSMLPNKRGGPNKRGDGKIQQD